MLKFQSQTKHSDYKETDQVAAVILKFYGNVVYRVIASFLSFLRFRWFLLWAWFQHDMPHWTCENPM